MESLYQRYRHRGLRVLAFPSNDFGRQEPGNPRDIEAFARTGIYPGKGRNPTYDHPPATFDLLEKAHVITANAHPVFRFLRRALGKNARGNFNKWLIDRHGRPRKHFGKREGIDILIPAVEELLSEVRLA